MENDLVFQRRLHLRAGFQRDVIQDGVHIPQRFDLDFQTERDFQGAFPRARALELHFIGVLVHAHENLRERDVFLRVEICGQLLVGEELVADQNPLARIDAAKTAAQERPAADRDRLPGVILEQDQIVITKGEEPIVPGQALQGHVRRAIRSERERFERRGPALVDRSVRILRSVQLINDIDGLRRHAELRHERVKGDDLFLLEARL